MYSWERDTERAIKEMQGVSTKAKKPFSGLQAAEDYRDEFASFYEGVNLVKKESAEMQNTTEPTKQGFLDGLFSRIQGLTTPQPPPVSVIENEPIPQQMPAQIDRLPDIGAEQRPVPNMETLTRPKIESNEPGAASQAVLRKLPKRNIIIPEPRTEEERTWLTNFTQSLKRGDVDSAVKVMGTQAALGMIDWEKDVKPLLDEYRILEQTDPIEAKNWFTGAFLSAVRTTPFIAKSAAASAIGAGASAIAGQFGPLAATPEEALTVPVGGGIASFAYWSSVGAGGMYNAMREEGVNHDIAKYVAFASGPIYGYIEKLQIDKLLPGSSSVIKRNLGRVFAKNMMVFMQRKGLDFVSQISQEGIQSIIENTAVEAGKWIDPEIKGTAVGEAFVEISKGAGKEMWEAFKTVPFLMAPGVAVDTGRTYLGTKGAQVEADNINWEATNLLNPNLRPPGRGHEARPGQPMPGLEDVEPTFTPIQTQKKPTPKREEQILPGILDKPEQVGIPIQDFIGKVGIYDNKKGVLDIDDMGNLIFESDNMIYEVGRVKDDLKRDISELHISIPKERKFEVSEDGNIIIIDDKPYTFTSINKRKDQKSSITLENADGNSVTIRDDELVKNIEMELAKRPNLFQTLDAEKRAAAQAKFEAEREAVKQQQTQQQTAPVEAVTEPAPEIKLPKGETPPAQVPPISGAIPPKQANATTKAPKLTEEDRANNLLTSIRDTIKRPVYIPAKIWSDTTALRENFIGKFTGKKTADSISLDTFAQEFNTANPQWDINSWQDLVDKVSDAKHINNVQDSNREMLEYEDYLAQLEISDEQKQNIIISSFLESDLQEIEELLNDDDSLSYFKEEMNEDLKIFSDDEIRAVLAEIRAAVTGEQEPEPAAPVEQKPIKEPQDAKQKSVQPETKVSGQDVTSQEAQNQLRNPEPGEIERVQERIKKQQEQAQKVEAELKRIDKKFTSDGPQAMLFGAEQLTEPGQTIEMDLFGQSEKPVTETQKAPHQMTKAEYRAAVLADENTPTMELGFTKKIPVLAKQIKSKTNDPQNHKIVLDDFNKRVETSHQMLIFQALEAGKQAEIPANVRAEFPNYLNLFEDKQKKVKQEPKPEAKPATTDTAKFKRHTMQVGKFYVNMFDPTSYFYMTAREDDGRDANSRPIGIKTFKLGDETRGDYVYVEREWKEIAKLDIPIKYRTALLERLKKDNIQVEQPPVTTQADVSIPGRLQVGKYYYQEFQNGDRVYFYMQGTHKNGNPHGILLDSSRNKPRKGSTSDPKLWTEIARNDIPKKQLKPLYTEVGGAAVEKQKADREKPSNYEITVMNMNKRHADKLRVKADSLQARIDERLSDRQTNTAKRAREASRIRTQGYELKRFQTTLRTIADAIESGKAKMVANIRSASEVQAIEAVLSELHRKAYNQEKAERPTLQYDDYMQEPINPKYLEDAQLPLAVIDSSIMDRYSIKDAFNTDGYKQDAKRIQNYFKNHRSLASAPSEIIGSLKKIVQKFDKNGFTNDRIIQQKNLAKLGAENRRLLVDLVTEFHELTSKQKVDVPEKAELDFKAKFDGVLRQSHPGFFPTPKVLIDKMIDEADIEKGMKVLEPSAGRGDIAIALREAGFEPDVVEWSRTLRNLLEEQNFNVVADDFFQVTDTYDRIIMNPPFEKLADIDHVKHAYSLLKPGGKIVSIMSESPFSNSQKKAQEFRDWAISVGAYSEKNEPKAFMEGPRQTGVNTRTVYIDKQGPPVDIKARAKKDATIFPSRSTNAEPFNIFTPFKKQNLADQTEFKNRQEMVRYLSEKLGVPIRKGKYNHPRALGIFKITPRIIRVKKGLLETHIHEVAHYLRESIPDFKRENLKPFTKEFKGIQTKGDVLEEGNAEFTRMWVLHPEEAKARAPKYYDYFEKMMEKHSPESLEVLKIVQADAKRWAELPETQKILSEIDKNPTKKKIWSWKKIYSMAFEDIYAIHGFTKLAEKAGISVKDRDNPYLQASLLKGWSGKALHFFHRGTLDAQNNKLGRSLESILQPYQTPGDLDNFRIYLMSKRTVSLVRDRGIRSQISPRGALASIKELETQYPTIKEDAEALYNFQDEVLFYARDKGLLSEELVTKIRKMNKHYVPFYRVYEETLRADAPAGKSIGDTGQVIKRISPKGSEREFIDPIESIIKNTYSLINAAERNAVAYTMARLASRHHSLAQMFERIPRKRELKAKVTVEQLLGKDFINSLAEDERIPGEVLAILEDEFSKDRNVFGVGEYRNERIIKVWRQGEPAYYEVEEDLYTAMKELDHEQMNILVKMMSFPARWLRAGATLNPDFPLRNLGRDSVQAAIFANHGFLPIVDTARGLFSAIKKDDLYWDWLKSGAFHSSLVSLDRSNLQENIKQMKENVTKDKAFAASIVNIGKHPLRQLQLFSALLENSTRIGVYAKARKKEGVSDQRAGYESRVTSQDFQRQGSKTKAVGRIIAFFTANLGGNDLLVRTFKDHPLRTAFRATTFLTLPSLMLAAAQRDDENYKEVPRWQKDLFWVIVTYKANGDPFIWRIPKPFTLGMVFASFPERILEYIHTKDPEAFDNAWRSLAGTLTPNVLPTALPPLMENWLNRDFFRGNKLMPDSMFKMEPMAQSYPYTSEVLKQLGESLNFSPIKMENLITGYGAGLSKLGLQGLDLLVKTTGILGSIDRPSPTVADIPILRGFVVRNPIGHASESVNKFYDYYEEVTKVHTTYKEFLRRDLKTAQRYKDKHSEVSIPFGYSSKTNRPLSAYQYFNKINRKLADIRGDQRKIHYASNMSPKQKRQKLDELSEQMTRIARQANATYKKRMGEHRANKRKGMDGK